jgi:uncharacterized protein YjgD (DUF1641 family)
METQRLSDARQRTGANSIGRNGVTRAMAHPIPLQVAPRNRRVELRERVERAPEEHAEALLAAYELLQEMHEQGLLDLARGALSVRDEILGTLAADANTPEAVRAIRNAVFLCRIFGSVEPERLKAIFQTVPEGIAQAAAKPKQPVTFFGLIRRLLAKDSLRALGAAVDFLQCFGRGLLKAEGSLPRNSIHS